MVFRIKDDYFTELLKKYLPRFKEAIKIEMQLGNKIVIETAKDQGVKTKETGLTLSKEDIDIWIRKMELFIKDANRDVSKQISNATLNNIASRGSNDDLAKTLKEVFNNQKETYRNRYKTIARSESSRILNTSGNNKAKKLGATRKYLSDVPDKRQGEDSKIAMAKYGSSDKSIPIDENFKFTYNGKVFDYDVPPNRPNDREIAIYLFS